MNRLTTGMSGGRQRLVFVDWLRGWALLVMMETHVFNAFLAEPFHQAGWFQGLNFVNGLVAPSFLFVSGFVFIVASEQRRKALREFRLPFWRQLSRIGLVWLIAYALHFPPPSTGGWLKKISAADLHRFYQVDILHCISFTWLFLLLSVIAISREQSVRRWLFASSAGAAILAPFVWNIDFAGQLPIPIAAYLNNRHHSLFPIFPWSGFMLAGAFCASLFLAAKREYRETQVMNLLTTAGLLLASSGLALPALSSPMAMNWAADPRTFLLRLGIVLLLLRACWQYGVWRTPRESAVLAVSQESLFVYVSHLVVLYGPFWYGRDITQVLGRRFGPVQCGVASIVLVALMVAGAEARNLSRRRRPSTAPPRMPVTSS